MTNLISKVAKRVRLELFAFRFRRNFSIFSHLTTEEKYLLYSLSKGLPDGSVCAEIGSYLGSSSCFIAAGLNANSKLYCIDTWGNHAMIYDTEDHEKDELIEKDTYQEFIVNTASYSDKVMALRGWSHEVIGALKTNVNRLELLFIDGDHNYEGVKRDWDLYQGLLSNGSLVVFHDTGWAEGVQAVIREAVIPVGKLVSKLPNMEVYRIVR